jgi:hypothetical protein
MRNSLTHLNPKAPSPSAAEYLPNPLKQALLVAMILLPIIACIAGTPAYPAPNDPLANLISRARAALGPGFGHVDALHLAGKAEMGGINGTFESWAKLTTGQYAESIDAGPLTGANGYDGNTAWIRDSKGIVIVQGRTRAEFVNTVFEESRILFSPSYGGAAVSYLGVRIEEGKSYEVISVTPVHGHQQEWWFDPATALLARLVVIVRGHFTTASPSDYESVGGLMIEHKVIITNDSGFRETLDITSIETDVRDLAEHLRRPAAAANDFSLPGGETSVPIELIDHHIFVDVMINRKGPFHFWFDTGGRNIIDPTVAWQVGARTLGSVRAGGVGVRTSEMQFTRVDQVSMGAATLTAQDFLVTELGPRSSYVPFGLTPKREVQGMIGYELPARFLTTIGYPAGRMTLRTPEAFHIAAMDGAPIPLSFDGTIPAVQCKLAGINATCELDTGSFTVLVSKPFIDAHHEVLPRWFSGAAMIPLLPTRGIVASGFGGWSKGQVGELSSLQLGANTLRGIDKTIFSMDEKGALADPLIAAIIGNPVLERFTMILNYPDATLSLVPNGNPDKPYKASR